MSQFLHPSVRSVVFIVDTSVLRSDAFPKSCKRLQHAGDSVIRCTGSESRIGLLC